MTDGLVGGENEIAEYEKVGMTEKVSKIEASGMIVGNLPASCYKSGY